MEKVVDAAYAASTGATLFDWLGSFWSRICEDSVMVRSLMQGQGVLAASLYQEYLDVRGLRNRANFPVWHVAPWFPVTIYRKDRNTPAVCGIKVGMAKPPMIGPQTDNDYTDGVIFNVGGAAPEAGATSYPIDKNIVSVGAVVDNIINPTAMWLGGASVTGGDGALTFYDGQDPFDNPTVRKDNVVIDGVETRVITVFCSTALIDRDYIFDHLGYVLGIRDISSVGYLEYSSALWDLYNTGSTLRNLSAFISALLNEPMIKESMEQVLAIETDAPVRVITDAHVYFIPARGIINPRVQVGALCSQGTFITTTVRIYNNLDPNRLGITTPDGFNIREDVPGLLLGPEMFAAQLRNGLGITWERVPITSDGVDASGQATYRFHLYGDDADIANLWADVHARTDATGVAEADMYAPFMGEMQGAGTVGYLVPMEFFMDNMLKAGAFVVSVNSGRLSAFGATHFNLMALLHKVLPAHTYMFVVEKREVLGDNYTLDLPENTERAVARGAHESARPCGPSTRHLTYRERIRTSWRSTCPGGK